MPWSRCRSQVYDNKLWLEAIMWPSNRSVFLIVGHSIAAAHGKTVKLFRRRGMRLRDATPREVIPNAAVISATARFLDIPGCDSAASATAGPKKATVCSLCKHQSLILIKLGVRYTCF
jgi:hypothetical protein